MCAGFMLLMMYSFPSLEKSMWIVSTRKKTNMKREYIVGNVQLNFSNSVCFFLQLPISTVHSSAIRARIRTENLRTTCAPRTSGLYGNSEENSRTKFLLEIVGIRSYSGPYSIRMWKNTDQNNSE